MKPNLCCFNRRHEWENYFLKHKFNLMTQIFNKFNLLAGLLALGSIGLNAQQNAEQSITVNFTPNGKTVKQSKTYTGAEAENFDITAYINDNIDKGDIYIRGLKSNDLEYSRIHFDSRKFDTKDDVYFCESVKSESKPFIGIATTGMDDFSGVLLERVINESAADEAAFYAGDVISYIDDYEIRSVCDLKIAVSKLDVGQEVEVTYDRTTPEDKKNMVVGSRKVHSVTWKECAVDPNPEVQIATAVAAEIADHEFGIFPNPSNGISTITFENESKGMLSIEIFDLQGKRIYTQDKIEFDNYYEEEINISNQSSGIYLIELSLNGKKYTKELVVAQK